jgi:serine/threonine protein phosphatase PrpC
MKVHSCSIKGRRPQNEDAHNIIMNMDGENPEMKNINFYSIFDGHGGKQVSAYLKDYLPKFFVDKRIEYPIGKRYVINVYDHVQKILNKKSFADHMGSTGLVVVQFKYDNDAYLNVINNGDSRCILCRDNFAMPLTKDHKPNWPEERSRIKSLGGKIEFDGYDYRIKDLSVSRAFGDSDAAPFVTHVPDLFRYKLDKADKFLVIGCDGLYDVMSNSDVTNFVLTNCYDTTLKTRINQNVNVATKLAEYAFKRNSTDNISVIVIFFD